MQVIKINNRYTSVLWEFTSLSLSRLNSLAFDEIFTFLVEVDSEKLIYLCEEREGELNKDAMGIERILEQSTNINICTNTSSMASDERKVRPFIDPAAFEMFIGGILNNTHDVVLYDYMYSPKLNLYYKYKNSQEINGKSAFLLEDTVEDLKRISSKFCELSCNTLLNEIIAKTSTQYGNEKENYLRIAHLRYCIEERKMLTQRSSKKEIEEFFKQVPNLIKSCLNRNGFVLRKVLVTKEINSATKKKRRQSTYRESSSSRAIFALKLESSDDVYLPFDLFKDYMFKKNDKAKIKINLRRINELKISMKLEEIKKQFKFNLM